MNINNNTSPLEVLATSSLDPQDKENFAAHATSALAHDMFLDGNANKVVGGHLLITKRNSSNSNSTEEQQQQLYNHQLLTNTTSLLAQQYQKSKMSPPNDHFGDGGFFPPSVMASLHKRLDRSQSEPVWQQEQLQPVSRS